MLVNLPKGLLLFALAGCLLPFEAQSQNTEPSAVAGDSKGEKQVLSLDALFSPTTSPNPKKADVPFSYIPGGAPFLFADLSRLKVAEKPPQNPAPLSPEAEQLYSQIDRRQLSSAITSPKKSINPAASQLEKRTSGASKSATTESLIFIENQTKTLEAQVLILDSSATPSEPNRLFLFPNEWEVFSAQPGKTLTVEITVWFSEEPSEVFEIERGPYTVEAGEYTLSLDQSLEREVLRKGP